MIKSQKVKGSPAGIKAGAKVRNIRLVNGVGGHGIDCKVDGIGPMQLKSAVVMKPDDPIRRPVQNGSCRPISAHSHAYEYALNRP